MPRTLQLMNGKH